LVGEGVDDHRIADLSEIVRADEAAAAKAEPTLRHEQVLTQAVVGEAGRGAQLDERRCDVEMAAHWGVRRPHAAQDRGAV